jgi:DNA-directed RNA polymerase specialized sigma24 family protein
VRSAFLVTGDRERAAEVCQHAFLRLHERWATVRDHDHPEAWVRRVALRTATRRAGTSGTAASPPHADPPSPGSPPQDVELARALAGLSGTERAVLVLHLVEGRPVPEVAKVLGVSTAAAERQLAGAEERTARQLGRQASPEVRERRLVIGLAHEADLVDPAVESALERVLSRATTRRRRRLAAGAVAGVGIVAAATAGIGWVLGSWPVATPAGGDELGDLGGLVGQYELDVATSTGADDLGITGRWRASVSGDGWLSLEPPPGLAGMTSGGTLRVEGTLLETDALPGFPGCGTGIGTGLYRWDQEDGTVTFGVIGQDCEARQILFADTTWTRLP